MNWNIIKVARVLNVVGMRGGLLVQTCQWQTRYVNRKCAALVTAMNASESWSKCLHPGGGRPSIISVPKIAQMFYVPRKVVT